MTYPDATTLSAPSGGDGLATFADGHPDAHQFAMWRVPGDFARFSDACFDVTFGLEVFVRNGDTNTPSFLIERGGDLSCRWYVIPEDADGEESPAASASATPKPSAAASRTPGAVSGPPSTGTGVAGGRRGGPGHLAGPPPRSGRGRRPPDGHRPVANAASRNPDDIDAGAVGRSGVGLVVRYRAFGSAGQTRFRLSAQ